MTHACSSWHLRLQGGNPRFLSCRKLPTPLGSSLDLEEAGMEEAGAD